MKKLIAAGMVVMMSLGVTACGDMGTAGKTQEQVKTASPTETVEKYFAAIQKADFETVKSMNENGSAEEFTFESPEQEKYVKLIFGKMQVETGEEKIEGDSATVKTKVTAVDFGKLMEQLLTESIANAFATDGQQKSEEELQKEMEAKLEGMLTDANAPTNVTEAMIDLVKKDGKWVVAESNDEMANAVLGNIENAFR